MLEDRKDLQLRGTASPPSPQTVSSPPRSPAERPRCMIDVRGNIVEVTKAESLWAVKTLKASVERNEHYPNDLYATRDALIEKHFKVPNGNTTGSTTDLVSQYLALLMNNEESEALFAFHWKNDAVPEPLQTMNGSNDAVNLSCVILGDYGFKNCKINGEEKGGIDYFVDARIEHGGRIEDPRGDIVSTEEAHKAARADRVVADDHEEIGALGRYRGRQKSALTVFQRYGYDKIDWSKFLGCSNLSKKQREEYLAMRSSSARSSFAGIMEHRKMTEVLDSEEYRELTTFFNCELLHGGKSMNARQTHVHGKPTFAHLLQSNGFPFIGGASGSIEFLILAMEEYFEATRKRLIEDETAREILIGWNIALLIAGGNHSLGECLDVAQEMGYFNDIASVRTAPVHKVYKEFEERMKKIGLGGNEMVLNNLEDKCHGAGIDSSTTELDDIHTIGTIKEE
eukprot:g2.t1